MDGLRNFLGPLGETAQTGLIRITDLTLFHVSCVTVQHQFLPVADVKDKDNETQKYTLII